MVLSWKKIGCYLGHIHWTFKVSGFSVIPRKIFPIRRVWKITLWFLKVLFKFHYLPLYLLSIWHLFWWEMWVQLNFFPNGHPFLQHLVMSNSFFLPLVQMSFSICDILCHVSYTFGSISGLSVLHSICACMFGDTLF